MIPLAVRYAVRDTVGRWGPYSVAKIAELFEVEGFRPASEYETTSSGVRREEADRYHAAIDFKASMPSQSGIRLHVERLERLHQEPEELIGAAKELVEATAKFVLMELGETVGDHEDLASLSKKALVRLKLHPETIAPTDGRGLEPRGSCLRRISK